MRPLTPRKALINQRRMNVLHKPVSAPPPDDPELAPDRPTCRRCGWDVRAGMVLCRHCEAAHATAQAIRRHARRVRLPRVVQPLDPDDEIPF
jgi:hypothetical protein